jgi:hypothetical protein
LNESIRDHCPSFLPLIACPLSRALLHSIWVIAIPYHPLFLSYRTLLEVQVSHQQSIGHQRLTRPSGSISLRSFLNTNLAAGFLNTWASFVSHMSRNLAVCPPPPAASFQSAS